MLVDADGGRFHEAVARVARWDGTGPPFGGSGARRDLYGDGHAADASVKAVIEAPGRQGGRGA